MHKLTLAEPIELTNDLFIPPGEYLVEDANGGQLLAIAGGGKMEPLTESRPFDDQKDWNGKSILVMRPGGFGDLVLLTPVLREIKRRWPQCTVAVSCLPGYASVFANLDFVNSTVPFPLPINEAARFDAWCFLENSVEKNPLAEKMHMTDLFAKVIGLNAKPGLAAAGGYPTVEDKLPAYVIGKNETIWVMEQYPRKPGVRRLCVQPSSSGLCRVYPRFEAIVSHFLKTGWEVFLLGSPGEIGNVPNTPNLFNLTSIPTTFRQACAVINNADAFLGNDSALLHIAGALKIPAVGLYGAFPGNLRTKYSETTVVLQGKDACSPCFHHQNPARRNAFPDHCPTGAKGYCGVLASIEPKRVVEEISRIAKTFELVGL